MIDKFLSIILIVLVASSCSEDGQTMDVQDEIPQADVEALQALGFSGSEGYLVENVSPFTNETYKAYLMEGDIEIPLEHLHEMAAEVSSAPGGRTEQYRTSHFIRLSGTRTRSHNVLVSDNVSRNSVLGRGIQDAIDNYNEQDLKLSFNLFFEDELSSVDFNVDIMISVQDRFIIVPGIRNQYRISTSTLPSKNRAGNLIRLATIVALSGQDFVEGVVTHAIGHNIGFRHSDWFSNRSCPGLITFGEGEGPSGAIHIPGTPARRFDRESIMVACLPSDTNGEFSDTDKVALRVLYGLRVDD